MDERKKSKWPRIKFPEDFSVIAAWVLLLMPAVVFWTSVVLYTGLGTDYVFDVVLSKLNQTSLGNTVIVLFVIGGPAMVIAISGMEYIKTKNKKMKIGLALGGAFLLLGFFTLLKKY
jgi:hypothetical protein